MTPKTEYMIAFPDLRGGLNLSKEYGMDSDESPAMKNLLWKEGSLRSRRGLDCAPVHGVYGVLQLEY